MKGIVFFVTFLVLLSGIASAQTLVVKSDTTNQWSTDGTNWFNAVLVTYIHPLWKDNVHIDSLWIWKATGVTQAESENGVNATFRKSFEICEDATHISGTIDITADNEFKLYLNNDFVGADKYWPSTKTYTLASLHGGSNEFVFNVTNIPPFGLDGTPFIGTPETNPAGLIYTATINYDCGEQVPEFGTIAALVALTGATIAFFVFRKN